jgi:hypothetical protein
MMINTCTMADTLITIVALLLPALLWAIYQIVKLKRELERRDQQLTRLKR